MDVFNFVAIFVVAVFCRTLFIIKILSGVLYVRLHSFSRPLFHNFILYNHANCKKKSEVSRWSNNSRKFAISFLLESLLFCFMHSLLFQLGSLELFWYQWDVDHKICLLDNSNKYLIMYSIATELSYATNATHRKEMGRMFWVEVFWQGIEEHHTSTIIEWWRS